jgi:5'-nucleotidase
VQARIGSDKLATASDVIANTLERIVYRIRRGRPGTSAPGDENAQIAAGRITVVRHGWHADAPVSDAALAVWNDAVA